MHKVVVLPLARPIHSGDWHDAPSKWQAVGPGTEVQQFSTKKDAMLYAKIRRHAKTFKEACDKYVLA